MGRLHAAVICFALLGGSAFAEGERVVVVLGIKGAIGPATSDYFHRGLEQARAENASLVVLRLDTPGGLSSSMREIIQDILAAPVPVVIYVTPSGSRAASAGTYMLYASHVAAMAPGTNLGAATPVQIGGAPSPLPLPERPKEEPNAGGEDAGEKEKKEPGAPPLHPGMEDKAVNDAVAYIRSLAQMRGRNADWAEKAVREAASLSAEDALAAGVIDLMAGDLDELLAKLDGRAVTVLAEERRLETAAVRLVEIEPDWRTDFLAVITDPNVAYILLLLGMYGLIFEFTNPGAVVPGVAGAISLVLALYALQLLPVNYAGLGLLFLGIALMAGEAFAPSFGALGIGGVVAFVIGSILLFETEAAEFALSWPLVAAVALTSALFFMFVLAMAVKARGRPVVSGREEMVGSTGRVVEWSGRAGHVRAHGEVWRASSSVPLRPGQRVHVTALEGLTLVVEPLSEPGER